MSLFHSNLFRVFFPLILSLILFVEMDNVASHIQTYATLAVQLPYLLFAICILLCHGFNQGRVGMVALAMMTAYWVIQTYLQSSFSTGNTQIEFLLLAFTLPIACIAAYLFPEKRFFTRVSIIYAVLLAAFFAWSSMIIEHVATNHVSQAWQNILFVVPEVSFLPLVILLYSVFLVSLFAIFVLKRNHPLDVATYTSLLVSTLTFTFFQHLYVSTIFFTLGGVLLLIGIITTSHALAYIDPLTNIPGRRALDTELRHLSRKFSIAMIDIDHFKRFNDTYGHHTGDDVLKLVASIISNVKGGAKVYRYGGEEFTIIFKNKHIDSVLTYLEDIRENVANYDLFIRNHDDRPKNNKAGAKHRGASNQAKTVNITISVGVSDSTESRIPTQVIEAADKALYRAKESGRNKVMA